jgi:hypothetical protein
MKSLLKPKITDPKIEFLRGSLITLRRRCGKKNCHCHQDQPHETPAVSYSQDGKTRILTLPEELVSYARTAIQRYQRARAALEKQGNLGLRQLETLLRSLR